MSPVPFFRAF